MSRDFSLYHYNLIRDDGVKTRVFQKLYPVVSRVKIIVGKDFFWKALSCVYICKNKGMTVK